MDNLINDYTIKEGGSIKNKLGWTLIIVGILFWIMVPLIWANIIDFGFENLFIIAGLLLGGGILIAVGYLYQKKLKIQLKTPL